MDKLQNLPNSRGVSWIYGMTLNKIIMTALNNAFRICKALNEKRLKEAVALVDHLQTESSQTRNGVRGKIPGTFDEIG